MAKKIDVLAREVRIAVVLDQDYICLTDIARYKNPDASDDLIRNWLRNRNTIELLGIWEQINNPVFNSVEFDGFRKHAGLNRFNALFIEQGLPQAERLARLNRIAIQQMRILADDNRIPKLTAQGDVR